MQNEPNFRKSQMNVTKVLTRDYENKTLGQRGKNEPKTNPIYPCVASGEAGTKPISRVKNSCARLWALLQCFSENFDKPGEPKTKGKFRLRLRIPHLLSIGSRLIGAGDPMNLLGTMPAKEGKIDLKHSFCWSAFCFIVDGYKNYKFQKLTRKGNKNDRD